MNVDSSGPFCCDALCPLLADIVAKVPNCPEPIFLL
jgi:hypothetical protein